MVAGALAVALGACNPPRDVDFQVRFESSTTRASAAALRVRILEDGCAGASMFSTAFRLDDPEAADTPPRLPAGRYGFEAEARDATCQVVARVCTTRELPLEDGLLELVLADATGAACDTSQCDDGICGGDEPDAGPPPDRDAGPGVDAGPDTCGGDGDCPNGTCHGGVCCDGCWDGSACQPGGLAAACGSAGGACQACGMDSSCSGGTCVAGPAVSLALSVTTTFVRVGGDLYSGGANAARQRGDLESATPNIFARQDTTIAFVDVAPAQLATCGIDTGGRLFCWGRNAAGLLGQDSGDFARSEAVPQRVGGDADWASVEAGNAHICAIKRDGSAFCWGNNTNGQCGTGTAGGARLSPTPVAGGLAFQQVSPGDTHTCGITAGGELYCWGEGMLGQLGLGATDESPAPARVGTSAGWTQVSAGVEHTCGVDGGELWCFGTRAFGRLGNGTGMTPERTPVLIDATNTWTMTACGQYHSCGVTNENQVFCWGANSTGALGLGMGNDTDVPELVIANADTVAVGWTTTCATLSSDATAAALLCWGDGGDGKVGHGASEIVYMPTAPTLEPAP